MELREKSVWGLLLGKGGGFIWMWMWFMIGFECDDPSVKGGRGLSARAHPS